MKIKFRGKRDYNGEWIYGDLITYKSGEASIFEEHLSKYGYEATEICKRSKVRPETVSQFVGLWDDKGVEIYDGDIVKVQNKVETKTSYNSGVYFNCNGCLINSHPAHIKLLKRNEMRQLSEYCDYGYGGKIDVSCEIIGNIYDNPELITS